MVRTRSPSAASSRKGIPWVTLLRSASLGVLGLLMVKICFRVVHPGGPSKDGVQLYTTAGNVAQTNRIEEGASNGEVGTKYSPLRSIKEIKKAPPSKDNREAPPAGADYIEASEEISKEAPARIKQPIKSRTASEVESFLKNEERAYLGRHGLWDNGKGGPRLASLQEARGALLPVDGDTVEAIEEIKALQATYPTDQPKGCVVVMLDPVHCGKSCVNSPSTQRGCTQIRSARGLLRDLGRGTMGRLSYPAVIFHVDLTELDMDELREAYHPSHVVFQRVLMEEGALPAYAHGEALLPWLKAKHPGGDLTLPSSEPGVRGFGSRMRSRFFSGLLHHAPIMQPFDYYLRLEPEARVGDLEKDPFEDMASRGKAYLYSTQVSGDERLGLLMGPATYEFLWAMHPEIRPDTKAFCKAMDCEEETYRGTHFDTHIELVHMAPLRTREYWDFFLHVDRSNLFMCNYDAVGRRCRTTSTPVASADIGEAGETVGDGLSTVGTMTLAEFRERRREKRRRKAGLNGDRQGFENMAIGEGDFKTVALTLVLDSSRIGQLAASIYEYPRPEPCRATELIGEEAHGEAIA